MIKSYSASEYIDLMWQAMASKRPRPERSDLPEFRRQPRLGNLALREAVFFMLRTGARPREMREAEWRDLDTEAAVIRLFLPRKSRTTGRARVVALSGKVRRLLAAMHRNRNPQPTDKIFLSDSGTPWTRNSLFWAFRRHAKEAGLGLAFCCDSLRLGFQSKGR